VAAARLLEVDNAPALGVLGRLRAIFGSHILQLAIADSYLRFAVSSARRFAATASTSVERRASCASSRRSVRRSMAIMIAALRAASALASVASCFSLATDSSSSYFW
jgi:hypothetical protein